MICTGLCAPLKNSHTNDEMPIVIDNYSSSIFPWANISYIHFPYENAISKVSTIKKLYFLPYQLLVKKVVSDIHKHPGSKIVFANSEYTAKTIKTVFGLDSIVLYPPVSMIYNEEEHINIERVDCVMTISRFAEDKHLELIPSIAEKTNKNINFILAGGGGSLKVLHTLNETSEKFKLGTRLKLLINYPRSELVRTLIRSKVYLHTMEYEHFGISIIEAMSAGCIRLYLIPVVRRSLFLNISDTRVLNRPLKS